MPNKPASKKSLRKSRVQAVSNKRILSNVKALYQKGLALAKNGKVEESKGLSKKLQQAVDKAAKQHVVSFNKASRMKSTLQKAIKSIK